MTLDEFACVVQDVKLTMPGDGCPVSIDVLDTWSSKGYQYVELRLTHHGSDNLSPMDSRQQWFGPSRLFRVIDTTEHTLLHALHEMWIAYVTHEARELFVYRKGPQVLRPFDPHQQELKV